LEEVSLQARLVLPERGAVQLQVRVDGPDETGRRSVAIYSRVEGGDLPWTLHAAGTLGRATATEPVDMAEWPPRDASSIPLDGAYEALAERGYGYGPVF